MNNNTLLNPRSFDRDELKEYLNDADIRNLLNITQDALDTYRQAGLLPKASIFGYTASFDLVDAIIHIQKPLTENTSPLKPTETEEDTLDALIEALQIFRKYCGNVEFPTSCEHDILFFNKIRPDEVTEEDRERLSKLGFEPYEDFAFISYAFGSN